MSKHEEPINEWERRQAIALALLDAFRWTKPGEGDKDPFEAALLKLALDDPITLADEETILDDLLTLGWNMVPAVNEDV